MARYVTAETSASLLSGRSRLFFILDYDGVLVEIAPTPDMAVPDSRLLSLLARLGQREDTTVAVVSGRAPEDLARLLPVPGISIIGCHGAAEVCGKEITWLVDLPVPGLSDIAALARWLTAGRRGFLVEEKGAAVALHYRLAEPAEAAYVLRELAAHAAQVIGACGLEVMAGRRVLEVRHPRASKGAAVTELVARFPGWPVCFGDDYTDEEAFQAVSGQGTGVLVARADRSTMAGYRLSSPREVRRFLELVTERKE